MRSMQMQAQGDIQISSSADEIRVSASRSIELTARQCAIRLDGANITLACPGRFTVKAANHTFSGGARSRPALIQKLPSKTKGEYWVKVKLVDPQSGSVHKNMPYFIRLESGLIFYGKSDNEGYTEEIHSNHQDKAKIYIGHDAMLMIDEVQHGK